MRSMPDLRLQRDAPIRSPRRTTDPAAIADQAESSAGAAKSLSRPGVGIDYLASDSCSGCCYYPTSSLRESANPSGRIPPPRSPGLGRGRRARLPGFGKPIRAGIPKAGKVASEARLLAQGKSSSCADPKGGLGGAESIFARRLSNAGPIAWSGAVKRPHGAQKRKLRGDSA